MNKQVLLFTFLLSITSLSALFAQDKIHKVFGTQEADRATDAIFDANGNLIVAGFSARFTAPFDDVLLISIDPSGDTLWTKALQTSLNERISGLDQAENGNIVAAGLATHPVTNGEEDAAIYKFDANGNLLFAKTYGDPGTTFGDYFNDISYDGMNNLFAVGQLQAQMYVIKTDINGNSIWANTYGLGIGNAIKATSDGGAIVIGENTGRGRIIKLNSDGSIAWSKQIGDGSIPIFPRDVLEVAGGYFVTGVVNYMANGDDAFVMKLDANGNFVWKRRYGNSGTNQVNSLVPKDDTTLVIGGLYNTAGNVNGYSWVLEVNTAQEGDTFANHFYQAKNGGVELTKLANYGGSGRFVAVGTDLGSAQGGNNYYVMETDTNFKRSGCPPSAVNTSDFTADTFAIVVADDSSQASLTPDENNVNLSDIEGLVEVFENMQARLEGQFTVNGMPGDTLSLDVYGRNVTSNPYALQTSKDLVGDTVFMIDGIEEWENLVRGQGSLGALSTYQTYWGATTRWEDALPIIINGCETKNIGLMEGIPTSDFGTMPMPNMLKGDLMLASDYSDTNAVVTDLIISSQPNGIVYKKDTPTATPIPQTEFALDMTGHYVIPNVPMTNPNESYEIHLDMPGWPIINPHTNITTGNRMTGDPCYGFLVHDDYLEGIVTVDPNTAIDLPIISDFEMQVYPNPASDHFNLSFNIPEPEAQVILADFWGREIYVHRDPLELGQQILQIPVSTFAAGIYTIRIEIEGLGRQVKKLQIR